MSSTVRKWLSREFVAVLLMLFFAAPYALAGDDPVWRPVTPEELQMTAGKVDPAADAEIIFWDIRLDDKKSESLTYEHYVRAKILTSLGRERFSKLDIPYTKGEKIDHIAVRVIKPDGTIVNVNSNEVLERDIVKANKVKVRAKSVAIPNVEAGVIVEYQYRQKFSEAWGNGIRLSFQGDLPMQEIVYHIRPQEGYNLRPAYYNMPETRFVADASDKGFYVARMNNVPAYRAEPYGPPDDEVKRWVYLTYYYSYYDSASVPWKGINNRTYQWITVFAKPTDLITQKAAELTAGAVTDDEKLQRIYDFIQKHIKNIEYEPLVGEQNSKHDFKHAEDTLKNGYGNTIWVELLFASLAKASGYNVNLVFSGDRRENFFTPEKYPWAEFVHLACVAIKVNGQWKYFNSSVPYVPYGYLTWNEEGVSAMVVSDAGYQWLITPISEPDRSPANRTAKLSLSEDGTLEGSVRIEYFGEQAITRRRENFRASLSEQEDNVKAEVKSRTDSAVITDVVIENMKDNTKPLVYSYKIKVPGYAARTGKRLFLQPNFFEYGTKALFSAPTRTTSVYFSYPWSEHDSIEIRVPKGMEFENPDRPADLSDVRKIASIRFSMSIDKATNVLTYKRDFAFGNGGSILFPATSYAALKLLVDKFQKADAHAMTLKEASTPK